MLNHHGFVNIKHQQYSSRDTLLNCIFQLIGSCEPVVPVGTAVSTSRFSKPTPVQSCRRRHRTKARIASSVGTESLSSA